MRLPRTVTRLVVAGALLALAACGRTERLTDTEEAQADAVARGALFSAELRLLGENVSDMEAIFLAASELEVSANGKRVYVSYGHPLYDLAETSNAWLVGRFDVPKDCTELKIKLRFDDFGAFAGALEVGEIAALGIPVEFEAPVAALAERKHAVLHLDVGDSLSIKGPGKRVLTPSYTVQY